jgi:hypothetical protein
MTESFQFEKKKKKLVGNLQGLGAKTQNNSDSDSRCENEAVVGYSSGSNDLSTEAEESPVLRDLTKQRLVKTLQAGEDITCSNL